MTVTTDDTPAARRDEAGTAPGDRPFRPDVQGLRAVAILLVVLYHASIPGMSGGYVGVDVFFVISGFVITGVLLRERASTGRTSIRAFYGRRARRIIPAATLVIIATVLATFFFLGSATGWTTAVDGKWASVFLANFHFAGTATNYLASQSPPSPLQNYWSLAVEEQFYIVYPTAFLVVAAFMTWVSFRVRLGALLGATIVGSYVLSIVMTTSNPSAAYFSPFTRAWELALGGLLALTSDTLRRLAPLVAAGASWLGLGGILLAAFIFSSTTAYPGSLVAIPVLGTALVIAGGTAQPAHGAELVLRLRPFQLLGLVSYSLYLWHWPILTIAAQRDGKTTLPVAENVVLVALALLLAVGTYALVENPIRHSRILMTRRWASVATGLCLMASSLAVTTFEVHRYNASATTASIANAASGTACPYPTKEQIASMHYAAGSGRRASGGPAAPPRTRMVVVGDSTACTLLLGLAAVGPSYGIRVESGGVIGCGIVSGRLAPYYYNGLDLLAYTKTCQSRARAAEASAFRLGKPDIILWSSTDERSAIAIHTPTGNEVLLQGSPRWRKVMLRRMDTRLQQFIATGATVVLLLQPPFVDAGSPTRPTTKDADFARLNSMLRQIAARHPGHIGVLDLSARVCPSGPPCPYRVGGLIIRPDDEHYESAGSLWVATWLVPRVLSTVRNTS